MTPDYIQQRIKHLKKKADLWDRLKVHWLKLHTDEGQNYYITAGEP